MEQFCRERAGMALRFVPLDNCVASWQNINCDRGGDISLTALSFAMQTSRHPQAAPSEYQANSPAFLEFIDFVAVCLEHAQNAVQQGRLRAAHGLFQTALHFYDQARGLSANAHDGFSESRLAEVRQQLDACAAIIYENEVTPLIFPAEQAGGH
jgi:hypothetical protein